MATLALVKCGDVSFEKKSTQPELSQEEMKRLVLLDESYVYPEEQTRKNALELSAKFLDAKDGIKRSISKLITVRSRFSAEGKTLIETDAAVSKPETPSLYIANLNQNDGYIILSADKRVPEIIAIVGSGTIDSLAHPGLRVYLSNAVMHMDEQVAEMESLRGDEAYRSLVLKMDEAIKKEQEEKNKNSKSGRIAVGCQYLRVPGARTDVACPGGCSTYVSTVPIQSVNTETYIAPILLSTLWEQGPPYNNMQREGGCNQTSNAACTGYNTKYLAGCVAIAEGQVSAYFKAKKDPFWQAITNSTPCIFSSGQVDAIANLNRSIFNDYDSWTVGLWSRLQGCAETPMGFLDPLGIRPKYGLVPGEWRWWNNWDIRNSLANRSPVVISGFQHLCCIFFDWGCVGCGAGHEWVIDGIRELGVSTTYRVTRYYQGSDCPPGNGTTTYTYTSNVVTATQIHQNWGWGPGRGSDVNDWYAQGVFQSSYQRPGWDNNYNHWNHIVAYITPL